MNDDKRTIEALRLHRVGQLERILPVAIVGFLSMKPEAIGYSVVERKIEELKKEYQELTGKPYIVRKR